MSWSLPGFGTGAFVTTEFGGVPVEALRLHDRVKTRDGRFLVVKHVDTIRLDRRFLLSHPDAQPIEIPKDTFALNVPNQTFLMSGQQRFFLPGHCDQTSDTMAIDFVGIGKMQRKLHGYFTYHVFHCGERCKVSIDGLWVDLDPANLNRPVD
ncbi:Hint domain-containing protein [Loktanella sp. Alg231-35]|uniref:Hint domain-containing protein n=1 Tax=Loktanella sp. Alg231-35 TaxID=1922220 RepID=UPI002278A4B6|nr:Hint domain-containing protein [Loktanella sp. Alg231-35]